MNVEEGGVVNEGRRAGGKIEVMDGDVEKLEGRARGDRMSLLNIQFYSRWSFVLLSAARGYMCESMAGGSVAVPLMQCPCQLEQEVGMYLGSWR